MDNNEKMISMLQEAMKGIEQLHQKICEVSSRLDRLEKVDSIEHRVTSNQIDITDIKEALERLEEVQNTKVEQVVRGIAESMEKKQNREIGSVHKRLDSHLYKMGKLEEEFHIMKEDKPE
ncbi:hypothetical protein [Bacillus massilinigeriensis]|uniref:hypothetical protein n=1 Tax=Bacillus mediterraneensis TaxID=1805474 RepID=UPI0008F8149E|nr:hypothetical protein [Bacillus mediterraneensis]